MARQPQTIYPPIVTTTSDRFRDELAKLRFTDKEISELAADAALTTETPADWRERLDQLIVDARAEKLLPS